MMKKAAKGGGEAIGKVGEGKGTEAGGEGQQQQG